MNSKPRYYSYLDGWRGFAILWIVIGHTFFYYDKNISEGVNRYLYNFSQLIYLTVDIFFIISGFFITEKLIKGHSGREIISFFKSRFVRILPLYFSLLLFAAILGQTVDSFTIRTSVLLPPEKIPYTLIHIAEKDQTLFVEDYKGKISSVNLYNDSVLSVIDSNGHKRFVVFSKKLTNELITKQKGYKFELKTRKRPLTNILDSKYPGESFKYYLMLIPNYFPDHKIRIIEHLWFVSLVFQFYVFYALLFYVFHKTIPSAERKSSYFFTILLVLFIVINLLKWNFGPESSIFFQKTHFRADAIVFGCILKYIELFFLKKGSLEKYPLYLSLFFSLLGIIIISLFTYANNWRPYFTPFAFTVSYFAFGALLIGTYKRTVITRIIFENKLIRLIGNYSYGIYLLHYPLTFFWYKNSETLQLSPFTSIAFFTIASIVLGIFVERVLNGILNLKKRNVSNN